MQKKRRDIYTTVEIFNLVLISYCMSLLIVSLALICRLLVLALPKMSTLFIR